MHTSAILKPFSAAAVCLLIIFAFHGCAWGQSIKKISKEEVREFIGKSNVVIFDVRTPGDWESSRFKIESAVRLDLKKTNLADIKIPKDMTVVFY